MIRAIQRIKASSKIRNRSEAVFCIALRYRSPAFTQTCVALTGLLAAKHGSFSSLLVRPNDDSMRRLRQLIWSFALDPASGLPSSRVVANTAWLPCFSPAHRL